MDGAIASQNWWFSDGSNHPVQHIADSYPIQYQYETKALQHIKFNGQHPRRRRVQMYLCLGGLALVAVLLLVALGLTLGLTSPGKTEPATSAASAPITVDAEPDLTLSIDAVQYFPGEEAVVIDNEDHVLQCIATNVQPGTVITWDFGDNIVQSSRWIMTTQDKGGDLIDLISTINVVGISQGANNDITCFMNNPVNRRKRQALTGDAFVRVNVLVQGAAVAQALSLKVDSVTYTSGRELQLDEGPHTFECSATGADLNTVLAWEIDGKVVVPNTVKNHFQGTLQDIDSTIKDYQVSSDDCGLSVRCFLLSSCSPNAVEGSLAVEIDLLVKTNPSSVILTPTASLPWDWNPSSRTVTVYENVPTEFTCQVSGSNANPTVTLTVDGDVVASRRSSSSSLDCEPEDVIETLILSPVHTDHHGRILQCSATNSAESLNPAIVILNVQVPPKSLDMKIDSTSVSDSIFTVDVGYHSFECTTDLTHPISTVTWSFAGREVVEDASSTSTTGALSSTSIRSTRYLADKDCDTFIECTATNSAMTSLGQTPISTSTTLFVNTPPNQVEISVSGVGFTYDSTSPCMPTVTLIHGLSYVFDCTVTGADAEADVTWTLTRALSGVPATEVDAASTNIVDCNRPTDVESFAVTADYAEHQDQTLTCAAENSAGNTNQSIDINVEVAPTMSDISLFVNSDPYDHQDLVNNFLEGDSLEFECVVSGGVPTATVSWDINDDTTDGSLTTREVPASTVATCSAFNPASSHTGGAVSKEIDLQPAEPEDCYEILTDFGRTTSGMFWIYPMGTPSRMQVWCDMDTDGGGWTVFQRRVDGSEDFDRFWAEYKAGFGDLAVEHWLGNDNIYAIVNNGKNYHLRLDLNDGFEWMYDLYDSFIITDEAGDYTITLGADIGGGAGNSFKTDQDGQAFTTKDTSPDRDHDTWTGGNCADRYKGGFWYEACHEANLNGLYLKGAYTADNPYGIDYKSWTDYKYSLAATEMKVRPGAQLT